jgi:hypothetical protein
VQKNQLILRLKSSGADAAIATGITDVHQDSEWSPSQSNGNDADGSVLLIPWCKPPLKKSREILLPASVPRHTVRPIKPERRTALLKAIARGRAWLDEIVSGAAQNPEQIATRNKCSLRHVNMTISMAFIAPGLVKAAVEGGLPRGIGVAALRDAPAEWSLQFERLGLSQPN